MPSNNLNQTQFLLLCASLASCELYQTVLQNPQITGAKQIRGFHSFLAYCFWLWEAKPLYLVPQCMV